MYKYSKWKEAYWLFILLLLFLPVTNSFFINLKKITTLLYDYSRHKVLLHELEVQNKKLSSKVKFYKTEHGQKTLIKERLNKVEDGELIIKFKD